MNSLQTNFLLIIIIGFITLRIFWVFIKKQNLFGNSPINLPLFILSKILVLIIVLTPLVYNPPSASFPQLLKIGSIIYLGGLICFSISLYNLNLKSLMMGLPTKRTQLQTNGLYKFSRNPIYLSLFIIFTGSTLLSQHLIILFISAICMFIHHLIILKEEAFLASEFDMEWYKYKKKVKRYFLIF